MPLVSRFFDDFLRISSNCQGNALAGGQLWLVSFTAHLLGCGVDAVVQVEHVWLSLQFGCSSKTVYHVLVKGLRGREISKHVQVF